MSVNTTTGTVRCGHCKARHATVAQVRLCATRNGVAAQVRPWVPAAAKPAAAPAAALPSAPHTSWLDAYRAHHAATTAAPTPTPAEAPAPAPARVAPARALPAVAAGRYALVIDGVTKFFKVDAPTEGRWQGYTFLSVQAGDELYPVKAFTTKYEVLTLIAADLKGAMLLYGREIGSCGHCGRTLTNQESRERGIGPVCANKLAW